MKIKSNFNIKLLNIKLLSENRKLFQKKTLFISDRVLKTPIFSKVRKGKFS